MTLNAHLALLLLAALLLAPLAILVSPLLYLFLRRELRERKESELRVLWPCMARTLRSFAPTVLRGETSEDDWAGVVRRIDDYLALARGPRRWRTLALLFALELAPLLRGYGRLSRMPLERRERFADRHLVDPRGLMRVFALARQIVRIGWFGQPIATLKVEPKGAPRERVDLEISA